MRILLAAMVLAAVGVERLVAELVRIVAITAVVLGLSYVLSKWGKKWFPPKCPKGRAPLETLTTCVYEGENRPQIVLPSVSLVRKVCSRCEYEERKLVPNTGPTFFERGTKARWPFGLADSPEIARANVRAVIEWDQMLVGLEKEHDAKAAKLPW
jgi:hypothetical protein